MLAARDIPLIEDDTYGELSFAPTRARTCKSFDENGGVLLCSSFSKTLGPGLRVGWTAPGEYLKDVLWLKTTSSMASASLPPLAIAEWLHNGGYDHYLRRTRKIYATQLAALTQTVARHFPDGTRLTRPRRRLFVVGRVTAANRHADLVFCFTQTRHQHRARQNVFGARQVFALSALERRFAVDI